MFFVHCRELEEKAIAGNAHDAAAGRKRGDVLLQSQRFAEALESYDRALAANPADPFAWAHRGNALVYLRRSVDALGSYERALAINPDYPEAWSNRAYVLLELGQAREALTSSERAIALVPAYGDAHNNRALSLLLLGDFARGWLEYEWRWRAESVPSDPRLLEQPLWLGAEPLAGRTVLLYAEQGLGDTLQFCRYARHVAALGARVILEVQPPLLGLLGTLEGTTRVLARGDALPAFDYRTPLLSLPLAFRTEVDSVPNEVPYLRCDSGRLAAWQAKLGAPRKPRVGLVWSGNPQQGKDHQRSIPLAELALLLNEKVEWVSLQKEVRAEEIALLRTLPIRHFGEELRDFADTAALAELMDLIIAVDTSVTHLTGAMAKPLWVLLSVSADWHWLLERADSPWYPTARLFRQARYGEWTAVIQQVRDQLSRAQLDALRA